MNVSMNVSVELALHDATMNEIMNMSVRILELLRVIFLLLRKRC